MKEQRIGKDFWLREFCESETAVRLGREIEPTADELVNIVMLVEQVMQPIRSALARPISITSGLRPVWLNRAIGGALTSEHMTGRACDFKVVGLTPYQVCQWISMTQLPFNQLIHEFGSWTHISVAPKGFTPKRELLTAIKENGKTIYKPGIVPIQ